MNVSKFSQQHEQFRQSVRAFANSEIPPVIDVMEEGIFPRDLVKKMGQRGLMGIPVPTTYGGLGLDFTSYIIAIHELSKVSATVGVILSVHTSVGTFPILYYGTKEQKEKYIPKLASGEYIGAFCLTEPHAGSDAAQIKTKAVRKGDGYIINGSKLFITNGKEAHIYIVFAKTNLSLGRKGISAFIVEKGTKGLSFGKNERKMGLHGSNTYELFFENMKVPKENLLGKENEGFSIALRLLQGGRIGIAAQSIGIAEGALHEAVKYAKQTVMDNGTPIIREQKISFKLAEMATNIEAAKQLTYYAATCYESGENCEKEASMAKLFASKTAVEVTTEAIQILGVEGYTKKYSVERFFRDAKVTEIYEGTSEIQKIVIGKYL